MYFISGTVLTADKSEIVYESSVTKIMVKLFSESFTQGTTLFASRYGLLGVHTCNELSICHCILPMLAAGTKQTACVIVWKESSAAV